MTMPMPPRRPSPTRPVASIALLAIALPSAAAAIAAAGCAGDAPEPGPPAASSPASPGTAPSDAERVHPHHEPRLTPQSSGTTGRLQAVSPVDERVVWASGVGGTYALTTDGGATWQAHVVPGGESLEFRDVHGVSDRVAYLLAAGTGPASRIYKTVDAGASWIPQFTNDNPKAFFDALACWDDRHAIAVSDSVDRQFVVLFTETGGKIWTRVPPDHLPAAQDGEGFFAASGTNVAV
ncbi:MAG TPA: hypothetical protein VKB80_36935, partial [Kofleriaceae bacterium]|nr:hypothetical protein [Kofleriaceae bacterium]